jgi:osmotically-inducible protein OsmY
MKKLIQIALLGVALSQIQGCATEGGDDKDIDRRTTGTYIGDQEIELRATNAIYEAFPEYSGNISTTSYNSLVLLTGRVPDQKVHDRVTEIVTKLPGVRKVFNELAISSGSTITTDFSDLSITTSVKSRMMFEDNIPISKIKVVTDSGIVYLMGLVKHAEATSATEVARNTSGVKKVVTMFEYID